MYIAKKKKNSNAPSIFWLFRYQHFISHTFPTSHPHFFFFTSCPTLLDSHFSSSLSFFFSNSCPTLLDSHFFFLLCFAFFSFVHFMSYTPTSLFFSLFSLIFSWQHPLLSQNSKPSLSPSLSLSLSAADTV